MITIYGASDDLIELDGDAAAHRLPALGDIRPTRPRGQRTHHDGVAARVGRDRGRPWCGAPRGPRGRRRRPVMTAPTIAERVDVAVRAEYAALTAAWRTLIAARRTQAEVPA